MSGRSGLVVGYSPGNYSSLLSEKRWSLALANLPESRKRFIALLRSSRMPRTIAKGVKWLIGLRD
jgi:hypothetical protein